jgi:hypothetical protein
MSLARRPFRATSARTVELAGTNQFQMFATVNTKKLHGLTSRKCNTRSRALGSLPAKGALNSDQTISASGSYGLTKRVRPGPGLKPQDNNASFEGISEAEYNKLHMKALKDADPGLKQQATSNKLQATKPQASSDKLQAPSNKRQAPSRKRQAP